MTFLVTAAGITAGCAVATVLGKVSRTALEGAKEWVRVTLKVELEIFRRDLIEEVEGKIKSLPCMNGIIPDNQIRRIHGHHRETEHGMRGTGPGDDACDGS